MNNKSLHTKKSTGFIHSNESSTSCHYKLLVLSFGALSPIFVQNANPNVKIGNVLKMRNSKQQINAVLCAIWICNLIYSKVFLFHCSLLMLFQCVSVCTTVCPSVYLQTLSTPLTTTPRTTDPMTMVVMMIGKKGKREKRI